MSMSCGTRWRSPSWPRSWRARCCGPFPELLYPNSAITGLDRWLPCIIVAIAWSDVSLAALAYRLNVKATVTTRAVVEPWTISIAAWVFSFFTIRDGLVLSYVASMTAALIASLVPFLRSYGLPRGWSLRLARVFALARANAPLAGRTRWNGGRAMSTSSSWA
jgi:hypothetical protein